MAAAGWYEPLDSWQERQAGRVQCSVLPRVPRVWEALPSSQSVTFGALQEANARRGQPPMPSMRLSLTQTAHISNARRSSSPIAAPLTAARCCCCRYWQCRHLCTPVAAPRPPAAPVFSSCCAPAPPAACREAKRAGVSFGFVIPLFKASTSLGAGVIEHHPRPLTRPSPAARAASSCAAPTARPRRPGRRPPLLATPPRSAPAVGKGGSGRSEENTSRATGYRP